MLLLIGLMIGATVGVFIMAVFIGSREIDDYDVHIAMTQKDEEIKRLKKEITRLENDIDSIACELYKDLFGEGS